jgi:hypothetical protein
MSASVQVFFGLAPAHNDRFVTSLPSQPSRHLSHTACRLPERNPFSSVAERRSKTSTALTNNPLSIHRLPHHPNVLLMYASSVQCVYQVPSCCLRDPPNPSTIHFRTSTICAGPNKPTTAPAAITSATHTSVPFSKNATAPSLTGCPSVGCMTSSQPRTRWVGVEDANQSPKRYLPETMTTMTEVKMTLQIRHVKILHSPWWREMVLHKATVGGALVGPS